ncbi:MAG: DUF1015 family protein [Thermoplasmata archaeon]
MVDLFPVRAWHPDPGKVDPNSVVCPVYDTVSDADLRMFSSHPFNAARFVPRPHGMALEQFLLASVGRLGEALRSGAYVQDPSPAFYVYGLRYRPPSDIAEALEPGQRRSEYLLLGLVGVLDLDRISHGEVALHERTFSDRVDEREALADATGMNFAPIMAGYTDAEHRVNNHIEELLGLDRRKLVFDGAKAPLVSAVLDGTTHLLWRLDDPEVLRSVERDLDGARLLILDGHHRFTAAAKRHHEGQRTMPLVMLVEGGDRALQVLPWHRVLPGDVVASAGVVEAAREAFPETRSLGAAPSVERAVGQLHEMTAHRRRGFLLIAPGAALEIPGPASEDVGADFDTLHGFLEEQLGLDPHELEFVRSPRQALERAGATRAAPAGTAFLLPGITEKGIEERAFGTGRLMAHKSTMFLPKVAEGLIFAPVDGVG